eukprot:3546747-Prymnesium_polylepis.1
MVRDTDTNGSRHERFETQTDGETPQLLELGGGESGPPSCSITRARGAVRPPQQQFSARARGESDPPRRSCNRARARGVQPCALLRPPLGAMFARPGRTRGSRSTTVTT